MNTQFTGAKTCDLTCLRLCIVLIGKEKEEKKTFKRKLTELLLLQAGVNTQLTGVNKPYYKTVKLKINRVVVCVTWSSSNRWCKHSILEKLFIGESFRPGTKISSNYKVHTFEVFMYKYQQTPQLTGI